MAVEIEDEFIRLGLKGGVRDGWWGCVLMVYG